ncbi:MAG: alcohol dehydrogenase catalytic domain-containing protein [Armatimonadota bacterium]|nr:alcohol dehydrogenase catalytic domain-containing protein [Armatimonadota bacterium]MDR7449300.1 alcohol dehydrogenase catalytic domain-containing protein [Armatimonadota bacterium]MDR7459636.1 alcohol dehydrogenase catalytic domain-containing protein [Armatimonadota bacterium]MDR7480576.1 alcohol dehydrogenase catalytic domain-containing protein [Armatimonadota bacterium]MDR7489272.1 alcohol dehydrogenase catalytic domain-containing protein [Armatimonadota bacterium]
MVLVRFRQPLRLVQRRRPVPRGEQVLVRVLATGVCHSDVHIADGAFGGIRLPLVLGHEVAGEAPEMGPVLVYAAWGCGTCAWCRRGEEQLCPDAVEAGWGADGGYAEWMVVPSRRYLIPLGNLDPVRAAPLADAGLTPYRAVRRALPWLTEHDTALVIGIGGLGQFALQYLRVMARVRVVAVDRDPAKLRRAAELGADEARRPDEAASMPQARAVFDFVGTRRTLALAAAAVQPGGIIVQVGAGGGRITVGFDTLPPEVHATTSVWGSLEELRTVVDLARRGAVTWHVEPMPLAEANQALRRVRQGRVLGRLVLVP